MLIVHPSGPCRVLVADPPWQFGDRLPGGGRGAAKKYECLTIADIQRFPLPELTDNAVLFLWRVAAMPDEALLVARTWGFEPKAAVTWIKLNGQRGDDGLPARDEQGLPRLHMGMGHYTRASTEQALVCTRGRFHVDDKGVHDAFFAPVGKHSEKPDEFFSLVERLTGGRGPYVEIFARKPRPGWLVVGNEIPALPDDDRGEGALRTLWTPGVSKVLAAKLEDEKTILTAGDIRAAVAASDADQEPLARAPTDAGYLTQPGSAMTTETATAAATKQAQADEADTKNHARRMNGWDKARAHAVLHDEEDGAAEPGGPIAPVTPNPISVAAQAINTAAVSSGAVTLPPKRDPLKLEGEKARQAAYVTRAIEEGILPKTIIASEWLEGAWIKLQFVAPKGFFDRPVGDDPLAPAAGTGDEVPIADLARALAKVRVSITVPQLAAMNPNDRYRFAAWVNRGAAWTEMPEALLPFCAPVASAFAGCAACDAGKPFLNGTEYLHTGTGPLCARADAAKVAAPDPAPTDKSKNGRGRKKKEEAAVTKGAEREVRVAASWEAAKLHAARFPVETDYEELDA